MLALVLAALLAAVLVGAVPSAQATTAPTTVSITFDDGLAEQGRAADVLHKYGLTGTFYINTGAVGTLGYFGRADLKRIAALGDEIGGHTASHLDLTGLPPDEARRQICTDRATLTSWGFPVRSFAYPYATHNGPVEAIAQGCGYTSARAIDGILRPDASPGTCPSCPVAETIPPADPYVIRTPQQVDSSSTLADIERVVTNAEQQGGGWLVLVLHHECDENCTGLSISPGILDGLAGWLAPREVIGTRVRTVGEVIGGAARPAVAAPPAPPHGVVNASLEASSDTGIPDCWLRTGWGTNSARWEQTGAAHRGARAQRVTVTSYTSGDAKLLPRLDLGQCTQPVAPRSRHLLQAWYQSSARTQFAVYYRTSWGRWAYWTSSPWFPPSTGWAQASWATPPAPADAAGLAFGLALPSVGSLSTDDYAMTAAPAAAAPTAGAGAVVLPPGGFTALTWLAAMVVLVATWVVRPPRNRRRRGSRRTGVVRRRANR